MAGLLVGLLVLLSLLSSSRALHQAFHQGEHDGANACGVCLLVKGQLEAPVMAPVIRMPVPENLGTLLQAAPPRQVFTFLPSPSRAPPVPAFPVVVAV